MKTGILGVTLLLGARMAFGDALTQSTFTEVIKDVEVVDPSTHDSQAAKIKDLFKAPNLVRTGPSSRAELTAPDNSITRVGANTVFSFADSGREINLEQGCVLFHTPHGKGGGVIKSGGASAAVTGTTLIVAAVPSANKDEQGGFKVVMLEGSGEVKLKNGRKRTLKPGELIFVMPGQADFGAQVMINLGKLVAGSTLVHGYSAELPSQPLINASILKVNQMIENGQANDTGKTVGKFLMNPPPPGGSFNGNNGGDPNNFQHASYYNTLQSFANGGNNPNVNIPGLVTTTYTYYDFYGIQQTITVRGFGTPATPPQVVIGAAP